MLAAFLLVNFVSACISRFGGLFRHSCLSFWQDKSSLRISLDSWKIIDRNHVSEANSFRVFVHCLSTTIEQQAIEFLFTFTCFFLNLFVVITQWSIFAIHNLTEGNEENRQFIAQLNMQGVANNQAVLEDMGLELQTDSNGLVVKKLKR